MRETMERNGVRLVDRTISILSFLAQKREGAGVAEIAAAVALSPATTYRILAALCEHKAAVRIAKGLYQMGPLTLFWGQAYDRKTGLAEVGGDIIQRVWEESRETVNLFYLEGRQLCFIKRLPSPQPISTNCRVGGLLRLYASSAGRAVLAALPDREVDAYFDAVELTPLTPRTIASRDGLWEKIREARRLGYGEENEENEPGVRCVGAAVLNADHRPVGAVSVTAPAFRMDDAAAKFLGERIAWAASAISAEMGCKGPGTAGASDLFRETGS